jgi:hypothetical protein
VFIIFQVIEALRPAARCSSCPLHKFGGLVGEQRESLTVDHSNPACSLSVVRFLLSELLVLSLARLPRRGPLCHSSLLLFWSMVFLLDQTFECLIREMRFLGLGSLTLWMLTLPLSQFVDFGLWSSCTKCSIVLSWHGCTLVLWGSLKILDGFWPIDVTYCINPILYMYN